MADPVVSDLEYCVVSGTAADRNEFIRAVEERMRNGWICNGGVSIAAAGADTVLYQAMTKMTEMRTSEYRRRHGRDPPLLGGSRKRKTRRN